jgi:quercetin dioxygenase-like cupin family protein
LEGSSLNRTFTYADASGALVPADDGRGRTGCLRNTIHCTAPPTPSKETPVHVLAKQPSVKGPAEMFTGDVWFDVIVKGDEPSRMRVNTVRFAPGAHTAWHSHAVGQTLHVTEGVGLIQSRGGTVIEIHPGDTIYTPSAEWHWHGAAPDHFMTHIAMWEAPAPDTGPESEWGDIVTKEEYQATDR